MISWSDAIKYANLVKIAESVDPKADYSADDKVQIQTAGYTFVQQLYGDELATSANPHLGEIVSFGFLAISAQKELVVAIRGTATIIEWVHDASFLMVPCPITGAHGLTEDGFTAVYRSLRIQRLNGSLSAKDSIKSYLDTNAAASVTVSGHSLGGALATMLALDVALNTSCHAPVSFTYASPRTGDHLFAAAYNASIASSFRVVNRLDLVPQLPSILPLPYEHVNTKCELVPNLAEIKLDLVCMHHLTTYLYLMGKQAGQALPLNQECKA